MSQVLRICLNHAIKTYAVSTARREIKRKYTSGYDNPLKKSPVGEDPCRFVVLAFPLMHEEVQIIRGEIIDR